MTDRTEEFIEHMGLMTHAEGAPKIAGQILGYLIIEGAPRTLTQMTDALRISKASASTNARLLELRGLARRVSPVGQRQDAYEAIEPPNLAVIRALGERFRENADKMSEIGTEFPPTHAAARERVEKFAQFYRKTAEFLDDWCATLSDSRDTAEREQKEKP